MTVRSSALIVLLTSAMWMGCGSSNDNNTTTNNPPPAAPTPTTPATPAPAPTPAPTPTPTPIPQPAIPPTSFESSFGDRNLKCDGTIEVNTSADDGKGEFSLKAGPANKTLQLLFIFRDVQTVLATFTTDASGNGSGNFQMSPGVYTGYFIAQDSNKTRYGSDGFCATTGTFDKRHFVRSTTVTVGRVTDLTIGTDPLDWGKAEVTVADDGHAKGEVEVHGAAKNMTYTVRVGEGSCGYFMGELKTDANGDGKLAVDEFGTCGGGNMYVLRDQAYQFQTGLIVK